MPYVIEQIPQRRRRSFLGAMMTEDTAPQMYTPGVAVPTYSPPAYVAPVQVQQPYVPPPPPPYQPPIIQPHIITEPYTFKPPPPPPPDIVDQATGPGPVTQSELNKAGGTLEAAMYAAQQAAYDAAHARPITEPLIPLNDASGQEDMATVSNPLADLEANVTRSDNAQLAVIGQAKAVAPTPTPTPKWVLPAALVAAYFLFARR